MMRILKSFVLNGDSFDAAKEYKADIEMYTKRVQELNSRMSAEMKALAEDMKSKVKSHWARIVLPHGIDPQQGRDSGWSIDLDYLEHHGVAFLLLREAEPQQGGPAQQVNGSAKDVDPSKLI